MLKKSLKSGQKLFKIIVIYPFKIFRKLKIFRNFVLKIMKILLKTNGFGVSFWCTNVFGFKFW